jgi:hypothetical protein
MLLNCKNYWKPAIDSLLRSLGTLRATNPEVVSELRSISGHYSIKSF